MAEISIFPTNRLPISPIDKAVSSRTTSLPFSINDVRKNNSQTTPSMANKNLNQMQSSMFTINDQRSSMDQNRYTDDIDLIVGPKSKRKTFSNNNLNIQQMKSTNPMFMSNIVQNKKTTAQVVTNSLSTQYEMMLAIEELRRENERITEELGSTQDLLDLFEQYRDLMQEHMNFCVCAGKDHLLSRWNQYESNYKRMMPKKRVLDLQNQSTTAPTQSSLSLLSLPQRNLEDSIRANDLIRSAKVIEGNQAKCDELFNMNRMTRSVESALEDSPDDATLQKVQFELIETTAPKKSLVRTFLDKIQPVDHDQLAHSSTNFFQNSFTNERTNASEIMSRKKRSIQDFNDQSMLKISNPPADRMIESKKFRLDHRQHQSQTNHHSEDYEVERLDKLNNALDQILMGRFDALNQLENFVGKAKDSNCQDERIIKNNLFNCQKFESVDHRKLLKTPATISETDSENIENSRIVSKPISRYNNRDKLDHSENTIYIDGEDNNSDSVEGDDAGNGIQITVEEEDSDDETDDDQYEYDGSYRNARDSKLNGDHKSMNNTYKSSGSTILSAVLKSGLKPYSNFHQINYQSSSVYGQK